jgi:hypothetical protein
MSKINSKTTRTGPVSPVASSVVPGVTTYGGGQGAVSTPQAELFRLGVNLFYGGEDTYYEKGNKRDSRFTALVEQLAVTEPVWTVKFLIWLRTVANIRTASVVGAAHFVYARLSHSDLEEDLDPVIIDEKGINRYVISEVLSRADEPGEFVAYWLANFGKLPKPVKRGIADSVLKLYNEYTVLKYDTSSHAVRFSDVINLTHVKPKNAADMFDRMSESKLEGMSDEDRIAYAESALSRKSDLFKFIIDKRYDNVNSVEFGYNLPMITAEKKLREDAAKDVKVLLDANAVKAAGMTWEDVLSLGGSRLDKAKLWEGAISSMGIFALVRNLRNFEEAGISKESRDYVIAQLTNPYVIANSKMFPFRFLSAFKETNSLQYHAALEGALELSTQNIPTFDSNTLVLIDISGSMSSVVSNKSKMSRAGAAALFGAAVAAKSPGKVDLVMFADSSVKLTVKPGTSVLKIVQEIERKNGIIGYGTQTADALRKHFDPKKHKRVFIFTDGQSFQDYYGSVSDFNFGKAYVYAFDLAGYKVTDLPTGKDRKYQLGGLSDATFKLIPILEQTGEGVWPWDVQSG